MKDSILDQDSGKFDLHSKDHALSPPCFRDGENTRLVACCRHDLEHFVCAAQFSSHLIKTGEEFREYARFFWKTKLGTWSKSNKIVERLNYWLDFQPFPSNLYVVLLAVHKDVVVFIFLLR